MGGRSRVRKEIPQLVHEFEQRQQQQQQSEQPAEGATDTDSDEPMLEAVVAAQPGSGAAADSAALQRQVAELALLVKQQAQRAEEQQQHARQQQSLIEQLRASPAHSPQLSAHPSPQRSPQQEPRRVAAAAAAAAAAAPAAESSRASLARSRVHRTCRSTMARRAPSSTTGWRSWRCVDALPADSARGSGIRRLAPARRRAPVVARTRQRGQAAIGSVDALAAALRARFQPVTTARMARETAGRAAAGQRATSTTTSPTSSDCTRSCPTWRRTTRARVRARPAPRAGGEAARAGRLRHCRTPSPWRRASAACCRQRRAAQGRVRRCNQMDIDDGDGASLDDRIQQAVLNAMQRSTAAAAWAPRRRRTAATRRSASSSGGARRGSAAGAAARGGRFAPRGPPVVPGVPEQWCGSALDAQQCVRCGGDDHRSPACPNAISASGN